MYEEIKKKLWSHQKSAITEIECYLESYKLNKTKGSALIQMPTGSGKSGVITLISRFTCSNGTVLVLTPRKALRNQLFNDINKRFFQNIGVVHEYKSQNIFEISSGNQLDNIQLNGHKIVVMTIQMLVNIAQNNSLRFENLIKFISLLIIDEGHYEPAINWSKVIRKINSPKIIFTATPYRNDFKLFDIDSNHWFSYSFYRAKDESIIRDVEFIKRNHRNKMSHINFAKDVLEVYDAELPSITDYIPRIIICCDNSSSIRKLASAFILLGRTVIGIHENFTDYKNGWERKNVPNPKEEKAIIWIHQYKLLEGIDDTTFQFMAMYERIKNARALVQQIGRIIRNPKKIEGTKAYVLEHWEEYHLELWEGFLKYDKICDKNEVQTDMIPTKEMLQRNLLQLQPKISYANGRFRYEFNLEKIQPMKDIQLPKIVNLYLKEEGFELTRIVRKIVEEFEEKDRITHYYMVNERNCGVILSLRSSESQFLVNHSFLETNLHITLIKDYDNFICFYDSSGFNISNWSECNVGSPLNVEQMKKLFVNGQGARLTSVSLKNSNLGPSSIRTRNFTAQSIENTLPNYDDYFQICTTAEGYSLLENENEKNFVRRYVGFSRGRLSEKNTVSTSFDEYIQWLDEIKDIIEGDSKVVNVLKRYALEYTIPKNYQPINILMDVQDLSDKYVLWSDPNIYVEFRDSCLDIENNKCILVANGNEIEIEITFKSDKYSLKSPELEALYEPITNTLPQNILKYINNNQLFRVLPADADSIYVQGQFYKPILKIGTLFDPDYSLGKCFITDNIIGNCRSEKGEAEYYKKNRNSWDPNSLFGIISSEGEITKNKKIYSEFGNPDIILCDDGGAEIADFILCDSVKNKVIFIHAKANSNDSNSKCATSKLHDVCGQAVKNLGYLAMFYNHKPSKINSWDNNWSAKVSGGTVTGPNRVFKDTKYKGSEELWKRIRKIIDNPLAEKEVWIFLGNIFSKNYFEEILKRKDRPIASVIQAAYLLNATMSDVASVGAKLKIFCKD